MEAFKKQNRTYGVFRTVACKLKILKPPSVSADTTWIYDCTEWDSLPTEEKIIMGRGLELSFVGLRDTGDLVRRSGNLAGQLLHLQEEGTEARGRDPAAEGHAETHTKMGLHPGSAFLITKLSIHSEPGQFRKKLWLIYML